MTDYIVFDFETTGFWKTPMEIARGESQSEVIQLSAIKFKGGEKIPFNRFVMIDGDIPEQAAAVHGITRELLQSEGMPAEQAWKEFAEFINEGLPLVGHNIVAFDVLFLEHNYQLHGMQPPLRSLYFDTAMIFKAKKLAKIPYHSHHAGQRLGESHFDFCKRISSVRAVGVKFNLALCCDENGIDRSEFQAHRADGDVEMTNLILRRHLDDSNLYDELERTY